MQKGYSLRAVVNICAIPLTTLRGYRKRGIISPDVANKSDKLTLYSNAQIEIAKAYRSERPPKNDKNPDADNSTPAESNTAGKKAYLVNPHESLGVKFNCLNVYLGDNGAFEVDAHFDTTNIETAYRRFVDIFLQASADIPALNGYNHFPFAKKLIQNVNGWENEFGEQIFFTNANESLCVDINEDFIYIFDKFNQHTSAHVAETHPDVIDETHDDAISSTDQPVTLPVDVESNISASEEITLAKRADRIRSLQSDVQRGIIQIGFELIAAKERVGHGNWSHRLIKNSIGATELLVTLWFEPNGSEIVTRIPICRLLLSKQCWHSLKEMRKNLSTLKPPPVNPSKSNLRGKFRETSRLSSNNVTLKNLLTTTN